MFDDSLMRHIVEPFRRKHVLHLLLCPKLDPIFNALQTLRRCPPIHLRNNHMNDINDALISSSHRRRMSDSRDRSLGEIRCKQDILEADWSGEVDVSHFTRLPSGRYAKFIDSATDSTSPMTRTWASAGPNAARDWTDSNLHCFANTDPMPRFPVTAAAAAHPFLSISVRSRQAFELAQVFG
jgi:hypothetical protein